MLKVRWTKTIKGHPLAFSGCGPIEAGKTADISEEMAAKAVAAGVAQLVKETKPAPKPKPEPKGGE